MENKTSGLKGSQVGHYPDWEGRSIITIISGLPTVKRRGPFKINLICLGQIIPEVKILLRSPLLSVRQSRHLHKIINKQWVPTMGQAECFSCIRSFDPSNNSMVLVLLISGTWGTETLNNFPKVYSLLQLILLQSISPHLLSYMGVGRGSVWNIWNIQLLVGKRARRILQGQVRSGLLRAGQEVPILQTAMNFRGQRNPMNSG